jgi:GxxExxY protein
MRRVERSDNYFLVDLRKLHSFAIDRLVENLVIVELKCVELFSPYKAQLLTYSRLSNKPIGLLLNFNVIHLRDGIKRILNNKYQFAAAVGE